MARSCQSRREALCPQCRSDPDIDPLSESKIIVKFDELASERHLAAHPRRPLSGRLRNPRRRGGSDSRPRRRGGERGRLERGVSRRRSRRRHRRRRRRCDRVCQPLWLASYRRYRHRGQGGGRALLGEVNGAIVLEYVVHGNGQIRLWRRPGPSRPWPERNFDQAESLTFCFRHSREKREALPMDPRFRAMTGKPLMPDGVAPARHGAPGRRRA
jgi:hypothetical protein